MLATILHLLIRKAVRKLFTKIYLSTVMKAKCKFIMILTNFLSTIKQISTVMVVKKLDINYVVCQVLSLLFLETKLSDLRHRYNTGRL